MKSWPQRLSAHLGSTLPIHSVRAYLLLLVVAVALPLATFALVQAVQDSQRQRRLVDASLLNTARALAVTVERDVRDSVSALSILASSATLHGGNFAAFYEEARRVRQHQPWYSVWLVDVEGHQLLNLLRPYGSELPALGDRDYVRQVLATGMPTVSGLVNGRLTSQPFVAIAVPVVFQERPRFVLVAGMEPAAITGLVQTPVDTPASATVSIVDKEHHIIARSRDVEKWLGLHATAQYVDTISQAPEGVGKAVSLEGQATYVAFRRLMVGGWTLGVGTPADAVDLPLVRDIALTSAVGLGILFVAMGAAWLVCGCLTAPLAQLSACARDIAEDRPPSGFPETALDELTDLRLALEKAGQAQDERRRLAIRERQLARELAAAEDRERQQIARDLHDELAQTLAALQIRLATLCRLPDPAVAHVAGQIAALATRAERFTRSLSAQIAPAVLQKLGLQPALAWLAEEMERQFDLRVQLRGQALPEPLPPEVRSIVYRAVRELLINVAKHAGGNAAELDLGCDDGVLRVSVRDHGAGLGAGALSRSAGGDPALRGTGLRSIKERLSHIGGSFAIQDAAGGGTLAQLWVPLAPESSRGP
jgi:signal transduction histidine kinase